MTPQEFRATAIAMLGTAIGWQTKIAEKLNIKSRNVRKWLELGEIPEWVGPELATLMGSVDLNAVWPRDEWVLGEGDYDREHIVHTAPPRFIARVVALDVEGKPLGHEEPADIISGIVFQFGGQCLCEIAWIEQPTEGEVTALLEAACDFIDGKS